MKDKEKQIEEMAKVIIQTSCNGKECENCSWIRSVEEATECCVCLKALYCAGYRKIPENAVVLTREEYDYLINDCKRWENLAVEKVDEIITTRKETAREILQWLKDHCAFAGWVLVETYFREQFGVEVDNN